MLGGKGDATRRSGGFAFEQLPQLARQAQEQGAAASSVDVDAVARGEVDCGRTAFEDRRLEASLAQTMGEREAAEAAAGNQDAQRHARVSFPTRSTRWLTS